MDQWPACWWIRCGRPWLVPPARLNSLSKLRLPRKLGWPLGLSGRLARRHLAGPVRPEGRPAGWSDCCGGSIKTKRAEDLSALAVSTIALKRYAPQALPYLLGWR